MSETPQNTTENDDQSHQSKDIFQLVPPIINQMLVGPSLSERPTHTSFSEVDLNLKYNRMLDPWKAILLEKEKKIIPLSPFDCVFVPEPSNGTSQQEKPK